MASGETYEEFVEKFKPKKTTDDCYTPERIMNIINDYVEEKYTVDRKNFIRPFYPGGDFEKEDYTNKIVVDNPPFSILKKILDFYDEHNIKYFLFCPALTSTKYADKRTFIAIKDNIIYENGAVVLTGFLTNLGKPGTIIVDPVLSKKIKLPSKKKKAIEYPKNVITIGKLKKIAGRITKPLELNVLCTIYSTEEIKRIYGGAAVVDDETAEKIEKIISKEVI